MSCPKCQSSQTKKNGFRRGKQCHLCKDCGYQFVENPTPQGYHPAVKELCIKMYLNGMGFRGIARVTQIPHSTIITWVKLATENVSDDLSADEEIPEITEIDELQTFVGNKNNKVWIWTVVNHGKEGILLWAIGDRSSKTFERLWQIIKCWHSFWDVTDGWVVYPS
jgi:transposase-like protein